MDNTVLVPDPVYPTYVDDNVTDGRKIIYSRTGQENGFLGMPDESVKADIIYICSPNNPTGAAYTRTQLKAWVDYARKNDAIILYDAAYECFISEGELARSIFEIEGARQCAVEICSFSKIAGFTGTRCGYTVVPKELEREGMNINKLWLRRQTTKFNGVPYVVQRAAAAVFTESGMAEIQSNLDYYRRNAKVIADALDECGVWYCGGKNSPYIWLRCPGNMKSWEFFDWLLENCGVVGTPTLSHEGFPGHLYQTIFFGNTEPSDIRYLITSSGYIEGWATYIESYGYQYASNYLDDNDGSDYVCLTWLNRSINLCIYSLLDIGIHYYGWSQDEAARLLKLFGITNTNAISEIYQYIVETPANYLKYCWGYLCFLDLKTEWQTVLGNNFNPKAFHQYLLEIGPVQFPVLQKYMQKHLQKLTVKENGHSAAVNSDTKRRCSYLHLLLFP